MTLELSGLDVMNYCNPYKCISLLFLAFPAFCLVRHFRLSLLNNFYCDILHLHCDCYISSVTSVNLKKAGMAIRNIVMKNNISF